MGKEIKETFKDETIDAITESGHLLEDVMFIGSNDGKYRVSIDKFLEISNFTYNSGYGASNIPTDLIVYFKDKSYITRGEYDGSEWWEYNKPLIYNETDEYLDFNNLDIRKTDYVGWKSVERFNKGVVE